MTTHFPTIPTLEKNSQTKIVSISKGYINRFVRVSFIWHKCKYI